MSSSNSSDESTTAKAQMLLIDEARKVDVTYSKYFAAGILVFIAGFSIANWLQILFEKSGRPQRINLDRWTI